MNEPPIPLEYRGPAEPPPRDPNAPRRFMWGLFGGMGVSAVAYFGGAVVLDKRSGAIIAVGLVIAVLKLIVGLTMVFLDGLRAFGAGVLTSLPIGFMIFFGACAMLY
jgi:hypothetical protein